MNSVRKQYDGIDLMKMIACIFVVSIHTNAFWDTAPFLNDLICQGFARLAVPLFFIASAFFFFRGESSWKKTGKYCLRICKLYLCWFIVTIPITFYNRFFVAEGTIAEKLLSFFRKFLFSSTFEGSWFLTSCVFCAVLFTGLSMMKDRPRRILTVILSVVIYLFAVFCSAYGSLIDRVGLTDFYRGFCRTIATPYLCMLVGVPYFAVGQYFTQHPDAVRHKGFRIALIPCLLLLLTEILLTRHYDLHKSTDCFLMLWPTAVCIFAIAASFDGTIKNAATMRKVSTVVFFSHFIWVFLMEVTEAVLHITIPQYAKFLLVVTLSLATAAILLRLSEKPKLKVLKNFY